MEGAMTGRYEAYDAEGRRKYLTKSEGIAYLRSASQLPTQRRLFCQTVFFLGCRITEALSLSDEDIDVAEFAIRVRCLKKRGKLITRRIPIPETLAKELKALGVGNLWPFSRSTGWRIIKGVMNDAGINGIQATCKGLRHAFGVRGALGRVPVNVIQKWMGHSNPMTTSIYLAVCGDEERELITRTWDDA